MSLESIAEEKTIVVSVPIVNLNPGGSNEVNYHPAELVTLQFYGEYCKD